MSAEASYKILADHALFLGGNYSWAKLELSIKIYDKAINYSHCIYDGEKKKHSSLTPPISMDIVLTDAVFLLRDDLLSSSGKRIWGLEFVLQNDGKFNITYDYNAPEWVNS